MKDHYQTLGIGRKADIDTIRKAYRKLVLRYHPDRNPDPEAGAVFHRIRDAYDVLSDPDKRRKYDLKLTLSLRTGPEPEVPRHPDPAYRPFRQGLRVQKKERKSVYRMPEFYIVLFIIVTLAAAQPVYEFLRDRNIRRFGNEGWARISMFQSKPGDRYTRVWFEFEYNGQSFHGQTGYNARASRDIAYTSSGVPLKVGHRYRVHFIASSPGKYVIDLDQADGETLEDLQIMSSLYLAGLLRDSNDSVPVRLGEIDCLTELVLREEGLAGLAALWRLQKTKEVLSLASEYPDDCP